MRKLTMLTSMIIRIARHCELENLIPRKPSSYEVSTFNQHSNGMSEEPVK